MMNPIDAAIVIIFAAWALFLGFKNYRRASENNVEYFLAGRSLTAWQAGLSMAATQFAADTPLLVTGLIAAGGISSIWRLQIYGLSFLALAFIFAPMWRRANVITDIEITELRYSGKLAFFLRMLKAVHLGTLFNCSVLAMVLLAAGRLFEVFLPWHIFLPPSIFDLIRELTSNFPPFVSSEIKTEEQAIYSASNYFSLILMMVFTWGYSTTGGLRSVVKTDFSQLILMLFGTVCFAAVLYYHVYQIHGSLLTGLNTLYNEPFTTKVISILDPQTSGILLAVISIQWIAQINSDGSGYLAQRILACKSEDDAKKACLIFCWLQIFFRALLWVVIGLALLVLYPASDASSLKTSYREMTFILGIKDYLPVGLTGIMLTSMLAALASTIDTHLNWGASYWTNDLYNRGFCQALLKRAPSDKELVLVARISNIVILCFAVLIAVNISSIQSAWNLSLIFGAGFGLVLMLRWLWWRVTSYCELAAGISSLITAVVLLDKDPSIILLSVFVVSSLSVILFAFFGPKEDKQLLLQFYKKVRPIGFWGPISKLHPNENDLPIKNLKLVFFKWSRTAFLLFSTYIIGLFLLRYL